jgi:hypothetical protein
MVKLAAARSRRVSEMGIVLVLSHYPQHRLRTAILSRQGRIVGSRTRHDRRRLLTLSHCQDYTPQRLSDSTSHQLKETSYE